MSLNKIFAVTVFLLCFLIIQILFKSENFGIIIASFFSLLISLLLRNESPKINIKDRENLLDYFSRAISKNKEGLFQEASFLKDSKNQKVKHHKKLVYLISNGLSLETALLKSISGNKDPIITFISEQLHSGRMQSNEVDKAIEMWFDNLNYIRETNRILSEFENRVTLLIYILFTSFGFLSASLESLGSLIKNSMNLLFFYDLSYNVNAVKLSLFMFSISIFTISSSYFNFSNKPIKFGISCILFLVSYLFFRIIFLRLGNY
ncbi:MAG: hypothetical protein QXS21_00940 [Thermoproteota archaeon]|nr:hypothetical protein [Candidatus Brockarchaeota archaeon]MBO3768601.1 hypothetical protein [Candidatus Brockarchaeota archaeon]MBO3800978.1 hypothetical protein [Candidatus Brockarchaeota archaeon]